MEKNTCYFCGSECEANPSQNFFGFDVKCEYCGIYKIHDEVIKYSQKDSRHLIAGYLQETKNSPFRKEIININSDKYKGILQDNIIPKTTMQRLEKLLIYCYRRNMSIGQEFGFIHFSSLHDILDGKYGFNFINKDVNQRCISYAKSHHELISMIKEIEVLGWFRCKKKELKGKKIDGSYLPITRFYFTAKGLQHAEQLQRSNINSNKTFVAIEYHNDYKTRLNEAIYPACKDCGFDAFIIDDVEHNKNIIDEMIVAIKQSKFVVADLTRNNSGVYYEAGYAKGLGREVIKCCSQQWLNEDEKNKVHFDLSGEKIILYNDMEDLKKKLKSRIRATIDGAILEDKNA